jgi:hypothetical protein
VGRRVGQLAYPVRHFGDRGGVEQIAQVQFDAEVAFQGGADTDGHEGVQAEVDQCRGRGDTGRGWPVTVAMWWLMRAVTESSAAGAGSAQRCAAGAVTGVRPSVHQYRTCRQRGVGRSMTRPDPERQVQSRRVQGAQLPQERGRSVRVAAQCADG